MTELSIFVDESGDFGPVTRHSPYYIVSLVLHDQSNPIDVQVQRLEVALDDMGLGAYVPIHTAPLIRRESPYSQLDGRSRRKIFDALFAFSRRCDISHVSLLIDKRRHGCGHDLEMRIARELGGVVRDHLGYLQSFDRIVVYYDKGQAEMSRVLSLILGTMLTGAEFRTVSPTDYLLFQVADLACTMKLVEAKRCDGGMSKSETAFFGGASSFKKTYLKAFRLQELSVAK